ncbi:MAG: LysM peptidoglycan-binding domain-containing protein [Bacteriovoracaceae bacterium]|nr:LysM peptidoglycan-binding domain-containing protein [Bacteriovoracaceae bacterium]
MTQCFRLVFLSFFLISCSSIRTVSEPRTELSWWEYHLNSLDSFFLYLTEGEKEELSVKLKPGELQNQNQKANGHVRRWIKYFTKDNPERFQRFLNRGQQYKELVQTMLETHGIPSQLYYLAMIESGYVTHARSRAKAVGVWQFMRGTGEQYGLEVNKYIDQRRDPIRATESAAKYLRALYHGLGSWELALAAYNCGQNRVLRAMMEGKTRDFWELSRKNLLPKETLNYVPKFIAAAIIGASPESYGLKDPTGSIESFPDLVSVEVPSPVKLTDLARVLNIEKKDLLKINPSLLKTITPPGEGTFELWVPEVFVERIYAKMDFLKGKKVVLNKRLNARRPHKSKSYYNVVAGDSLSKLARKFGLSINSLKSINRLRNSHLKIGQVLRVNNRKYKSSGNHKYHFVKRGESLSIIAKKNGLSTNRLKKLNRLTSNKIFPGQKLMTKDKLVARFVYKVKAGDNLAKIGTNFGISIREIKKQNGLKSSKILVGQKLIIVN